MIATLLASIFGFGSSLVPELIKLWQQKQDRVHELDILRLQMDMVAKGQSQRLEAIGLEADAREAEAIYRTYHVGVAWVDALNGTVRPVLAYAFFLLFAGVKLLQWQMLLSLGQVDVVALWGEDDQVIFATIISFYFGSRAMQKIRHGK
jgi:hypothetical protein